MPKFRVHLETVASTVIEVDAESKEEAYEAALCSDLPYICAQCSGWGQSIGMELGDEWDLPAAPNHWRPPGPESERIEAYVEEVE